jgi:type IV pilus assembly protein PilE
LTSGCAAATNGRRTVHALGGLAHNGAVNQFRHAPPHRRALAGFTLVEVLIVAVVLALLAAVALPSFLDSLRKSRRAEAFAALTAVQQAQERWRSNNAAYSSNLTAAPTASPPGLGLPATTTGGLYSVALSGTSATGYTVSAVAVAGKSQAADTACSTLAVRVTGAQITYAGCNGCSLGTSDFAATNVCWSR